MAITVTNQPAVAQIYQRERGTRALTIPLSGTHANATAVSVQYQIKEGAATKQDWKTLGNQTVTATSWSGSLISVPCQRYLGDWYTLNIRTVNAAGTVLETFTGVNDWAVGGAFASSGQSLIAEWATKDVLARTGLSATATYAAGFTYSRSTAGRGAVAFANQIGALLDMPILFFAAAVGGSALHAKYDGTVSGYWWPLPSSYTSLVLLPGIQELGDLEGVIWCQGENDSFFMWSLNGNKEYYTYNEYDSYHQEWWKAIKAAVPNVPLYHYPIGRCEIGIVTNANHGGVRHYETGNREGQYYIADHYDIVHDGGNTDIYHLDGAGYELLAGRCAAAIHDIIQNGRRLSGGPYIKEYRFANAGRTKVDVVIQHVGGKSLAFQTGTGNGSCWLGFDAGVWNFVTGLEILGNNIIRLTMLAAYTGDLVEMTYIHGTGQTTLWNDGCVEDDNGIPLRPAPRRTLIKPFGG